jgi:hypothetical protein
MENNIQQLLLVKDLENLAPFARRHDKINKLNTYKAEAFNKNGIDSTIFLSICAQLFDLYNEDNDYENARINAMNIYQGTIDGNNEDLKKEAIINLVIGYINERNIFDAKIIFEELKIEKDDPYYSQYCLCQAKIARFEKEENKEMSFLRDAYNYSVKQENQIDIQINILCALCLCYERLHMNTKALHGYFELSNQIAQNSYQISTEQQLSLEIRIASLAASEKNFPLSLEILTTVESIANKILRKKHPLLTLINTQLDNTKYLYTELKK